jgi:hypothetical protein
MSWQVLGGSVTGVSHTRSNKPCQDAFTYRRHDTVADRLVIVASDGAGSASHAEIGARLLCNSLCDRASRLEQSALVSREWLAEQLAQIRSEFDREAERLKIKTRELACTLLFAMVEPAGAIFAQIGDGAIVYKDNDAYQTAFWPSRGEYANETDFVTDDNWILMLQYRCLGVTPREVAVLTDGLQSVALDYVNKSPLQAFFKPLLARLSTPTVSETLQNEFLALLSWQGFDNRTDDDKTLIIAYKCA